MAAKLAVGDEVRVFAGVGRRWSKAPPGGWRGHVVRVGRTLCDIESWGRAGAETFVIETGRQQYGGPYYFLTQAQAAERDRRLSAIEVLATFGVTVEPDTSLTAEQVEAMAEIARTKES